MYTWFMKILRSLSRNDISFYEDILLKRSFTILIIQCVGLVLAFGSNILLARLYGEKTYGIYSLITSWCALLSVVSLFGMDDVHLVRIPSMKLKNEKSNIKDQLKWSLAINILSISIVAIIFFFIINFLPAGSLSANAHYFNLSLLIICSLTLMTNLICALRGLDKVVWGEIIDKIIRPLLFSFFLLLLFYLSRNDLVSNSIISNSATLFLITGLLFFLIQKSLNELKLPSSEKKNIYSLSKNIRYVSLNILYLLSTRIDILMLGLWSDVILVGHYNVATRFADIFAYPIAIINLSLPTLISRERHEKDATAVPLLMYRVSKNTFFQCLALDMFFLVSGYWILSWYGKGFTSAFPVLCIFLLSNLISAFTGPIDVFFIMMGKEKKAILCRIISLLITFALLFLLIPAWKIMGAAISMLIGNFVYCSLLEYHFFKQHKFLVHPFGPSVLKKSGKN